MSSFEECLVQIRAGDRQALEALLTRWRPILKLQARGLLGAACSARADSSDVVQNTLTEIARSVQNFRGNSESEWGAWVHRVLLGQASKMRRFHLAAKRSARHDLPATNETARAPDADPAATIVQLEEMLRLAAAIDQLSEAMQEVLVRRVVAQQPFKRVAAEMNRTEGAVRVLWTRALRKLRDLLTECNHESSA